MHIIFQLVNDYRSLRRAFRKLDVNNLGYLSVPEFRSVLKLASVPIDEEEIYQLLSTFDESMSGKIPYNKFLSQTLQDRSAGQAD
jgi:Ca2+-binding EF-hand superfamily protein